MQLPKPCECVPEIVYDLSVESIGEDVDWEEIDDDELVEDDVVSHSQIWQELSDNFDKERAEIANYKLSKDDSCNAPINPAVQFLEKEIFPMLMPILESTIKKALELDCIRHQKTVFNGIDFIAEMFWNMNKRYPERKDSWTFIFDMNWVNNWLGKSPRPYYPFSYVWSREWAATLIQAHMRGHWVRCRDDVQEMRQFWRIIAKEREPQKEPEEEPGSPS